MTDAIHVWLAGATGLVGHEVLKLLLEDSAVARVVAPVRRSLGITHPKLEERVIDFDQLEQALTGPCHVAICCLGTTIKQAGSQAQFRRVDHDYVLAFARAAQAASVRHFLVVTALGANPASRVFYNRVKGEVEQNLSALNLPALTIARPSLLIGERREFRLGERLAAPFSKFLPAKVRGIEAKVVARALVKLALAPARGKRVVPSDELQQIGQG